MFILAEFRNLIKYQISWYFGIIGVSKNMCIIRNYFLTLNVQYAVEPCISGTQNSGNPRISVQFPNGQLFIK